WLSYFHVSFLLCYSAPLTSSFRTLPSCGDYDSDDPFLCFLYTFYSPTCTLHFLILLFTPVTLTLAHLRGSTRRSNLFIPNLIIHVRYS
ncbi:hypothetical protein M422DRAFT_36062, partial [Sphaerobolus stellatus SS14]